MHTVINVEETNKRLRAAGALSGRIIFIHGKTYADDYLGQCLTKLQAWRYSDADEVCFLDSDLVFTRGPFYPESSHLDGMPCIEVREWSEAGAALPAWFEITKVLLGEAPPYETMCRHPFQYPTPFLRRAWRFAEPRLLALQTGNRHISEFNYLGNYAVLHEPQHFCLRRPTKLHQEGLTAPDYCADDWVRQFRSWDGITPDVEAALRALGYWTVEDTR